MMKLKSISKVSEKDLIEFAESSIPTAQSHPIISSRLAHFGYSNEKLEEGITFCVNFKQSIKSKNDEEVETKISSLRYNKAYDAAVAKFKNHRNKSLLLYKRDPVALIKLNIEGEFPVNYYDFDTMASHFYQTLLNEEAMGQKAVLIDLTAEELTVCCSDLEELKQLRRDYEKEMGETEQATENKNQCLQALKDWLNEYIDMARLAFYDDPQMVEVIGIYAKS